jgi:DNA repair exonuclease SbcCD ATPase subunit
MRIKLQNFRCYINASFTFDDYQVTRIKSEPGEGKSTIFEAIFWVLHGGLYEIGHHLARKNESTKVTLDFTQVVGLGQDITIYRQNHSNRLTLCVEKPVDGESAMHYEDSVAQNIIDLHFNSKKIWLSISYLRQGAQCVLLNGTKNERFLLLQEISSRNDDPASCIEKIDDRLKDERISFRDNQTKYETECSLLERDLNAIPIPDDLELTIENEFRLSSDIMQLQNTYQEELKREVERQQLIGTLNQLGITMSKVEHEMSIEIRSIGTLLSKQIGSYDDPIEETVSTIRELRISLDRSITEFSVQNEKLKIEQSKFDQINFTIQNTMNGQLMDLTNRYQDEVVNNHRRVELKGVIEHLQSNIRKLNSDLENMSSSEQLSKELNQEIRISDEIRSQMKQVSESIMRSERDWTDKSDLCEQQLRLTSDEQRNHRGIISNLENRIRSLSANRIPTVSYIDQLTSEIDQLNTEITKMGIQIEIDSKELAPLPKESNWPTLLDVGRVEQIEKRRAHNQELADSMKVKYDSNLPHEIEKWRVILTTAKIDRTSLIERKFIIDTRDEFLSKITNTLRELGDREKLSNSRIGMKTMKDFNKWLEPDYLSEIEVVRRIESSLHESINQYRELMGKIKLMGDVMPCPKCQEKLRMVDGQLVCESNDTSIEIDIESIEHIIGFLSTVLDNASHLSRVWTRGGRMLSPPKHGTPSAIGNSIEISILPSELSKTLEIQIQEKRAYIEEIENYLKAVSSIEWIELNDNSDRLRSLVNFHEQHKSMKIKVKSIENQTVQLRMHQTSLENIDEQLRCHQTTKADSEQILLRIDKDVERLTDELRVLNTNQKSDPELQKFHLEHAQFSMRHDALKIDDMRTMIRIRTELVQNIQMKVEELNQHKLTSNELGVDRLPEIQDEITSVKRSIDEAKASLNDSELVDLRTLVESLQIDIDQQEKRILQVDSAKERLLGFRNRILEHQQEISRRQVVLEQLGDNNSPQIRMEIEELNEDLRLVQQGIRLTAWQTELIGKQNELIDQQVSLSALEELRELAERVQYESLEETINSINNAMNYVFTKVFDDEIQVELKLFREIKSTKRITAQVNCIVYYKGAVYNRIGLISGGEKNRLNLGMILALNMVTSSPIIILDECANFLNNRLRERCMAAVKALVKGSKTVLTVCHEDNDANYDHNMLIGKTDTLDSSYPLVDGSEREHMRTIA